MHLKSIPFALTISLMAITTTQLCADDAYPLVDAVEFTHRSGLPNFFQKLETGVAVKVGYLGGSITAQKGWRVQSLAWFQAQYPEVRIEQIDAAIGGTGSTLGVFRAEQDVLQEKPDLLFVEFAVNDAKASPENILKAMEGIVRKTWAALPETDICFVYTMTFRESEPLAAGKMKRSASVMEELANYYGIPSVHMGLRAAQMEKAGELVMKTEAPMLRVSGDDLNESASLPTDEAGRIIFSKDGVHPYPETGHVLYTEALIRAMEKLRTERSSAPHAMVAPLRADNLENANQFKISEHLLAGSYENLTQNGDALALKFANRLTPLYRLNPGATLSFKFKGTKAMVYDLLGPDAATLEVTVDGKKTLRTERMDGYCTYSRLATLGVAKGLADTTHTVTVRVLAEPFDKRKILFERNQDDFDNSPEKYEPNRWHAGSIFVVGELIHIQ